MYKQHHLYIHTISFICTPNINYMYTQHYLYVQMPQDQLLTRKREKMFIT